MMVVIPYFWYSLSALLISSWADLTVLPACSDGITLRTRFEASLYKTPVGTPFLSFAICPLQGLGVFLSIPANFKARLFATTAPNSLDKTTGLSGETSSRSHLVGSLYS